MKTKPGILLIFFQVTSHLTIGQQYQTKVYFEVAEDAINNVIEAQSIPRSFSGTYNGINYRAAANVQIKLKTNQISARLVVSGNLSYSNGSSKEIIWVVNPSVTINNFDITATEIIGILQSIPSLVNSQSEPQFLKDIIINAYEDLELTLYPQRLLDVANDLVPTFLDIQVDDIWIWLDNTRQEN